MYGKSKLGRAVFATTTAALLCTSLTVTSAPSKASTMPTPPAASLHVVNTTGNAGNWYSGAIPANGGTWNPVLVFVQGLHSDASQWFQDGMYQYAYNNEYRTAFVQLADSDGTGGSVQTNGAILAKQLQAITSYYGVAKVDVIAHSKGGNDTQAAIAFDGANRYINQVFELSTPNYGSQLADLAYSWWAGWLASLLGQRDAAVYDLQTSRMENFRNRYDNFLATSNVDFDTTAGTNHGPWFSSLWYGGAYLSAYGPNDGAVTVDSAHLPAWYSIHAWTDDPDNASITYNHNSIHQASNTWQFIQPWLESIWNFSANAVSTATVPTAVNPAATSGGPKTWTSPAVVYRGGPFGGINGSKVETFTVDPSTTNFTLGVLTAHADANVVLYGPNGKVVHLAGKQQNRDGIFAKAYSFDYVVSHAQPGTYRLALSESTADGYLVVGEMEGATAPVVTAQTTGLQPGGSMPVAIRIPGAKHDTGTVSHVTISKVTERGSIVVSQQAITPDPAAIDTWVAHLTSPATPGVYNVAISLSSFIQGQKAERSVTYSVTVGSGQ